MLRPLLAYGLASLAALTGCGAQFGETALERDGGSQAPSPRPAQDAGPREQVPSAVAPSAEPGPVATVDMTTDMAVNMATDMDSMPEKEAASAPSASDPPGTNLKVARSADFDGYLTDAAGRALYMFVDDAPTTRETACLDACAREWPPFDVMPIVPTTALEPDELGRFHRQDGAWQTTYKGHPLYYRASEAGAREVTGDGIAGRWFVARDYLLFMGSSPALLTQDDVAASGVYLTDGFGRALYLCLDDEPAGAMNPAQTSCTGECAQRRPPWYSTAALRSTAIPSAIALSAFGGIVRDDGGAQFTYRGWPLYYYRNDLELGAISGHNQMAWRVVDPHAFSNQ